MRYSFAVASSRAYESKAKAYVTTSVFTTEVGPQARYYIGKKAIKGILAANGSYTVYAKVTDVAGNVSDWSEGTSLTVNKTTVATLATVDLITADDSAGPTGTTADNKAADAKGQTAEILKKIDGFLKECGTDKSKILSANVWVADMNEKPLMDTAWTAWVDPNNKPVRACVEAKLGSSDTRVEIMVTAAK